MNTLNDVFILVQNFDVKRIVVNSDYSYVSIYFENTKTFLDIKLSCTNKHWNEMEDRLFNVYDIKKIIGIISEYYVKKVQILETF
jgi:hypothetical protein